LQAPLDGSLRRLGLLARRWRRFGRLGDQRRQAGAGVGAVLLLRAEAAGLDDDDTVLRRALPGELDGPFADPFGHPRRIRRIEAELHRRRDLVDVLAAWARRADEVLDELVLADRHARGDLDGDHSRHTETSPSGLRPIAGTV